MSEELSDFYRDPAVMLQLKAIAAGIFARHGVDFVSAKRAGGWTNATWLAGGLALRMAVKPGRETIRREARLSALFPVEVGYPPIFETGITDGYEWCLSKEIQAQNLGEVWSGLDWDERVSALRQLWKKALAVHAVDLAAAEGLAGKQAWFNATSAEQARCAMERLARQKILTPQQVAELEGALGNFWRALPSANCVLNHGDLTVENSLWRDGQVESLLDFEHAVIAPPELDLNELVKCTFTPDLGGSTPGPESAGRKAIQAAVIEMALPVLDHPGGRDLLFGYAILLELWMLEDWLAHPEGEGSIETWQPYQMLVSLADGKGGYLEPFLAQAPFLAQ